jgi:zinc D-Ala-D-Ala carboxypeptidase
LSNAGLPGKPEKIQAASLDDIPIAQRETVDDLPVSKQQLSPIVLASLIGASAIALSTGGWLFYQSRTNSPQPAPTVAASASPAADGRLLNHFPYQDAPESDLEAITPDGAMKLRAPAAKAFKEMSAAAATAGVNLAPLSAFRSEGDQQQVFNDVKAERNQTVEQRADVSAPPGYSEHHTGYAIDIGDANTPATNLSPTFEQTAAFQWLQANAARYHFELSFPKDNTQGITYEPWHWRFLGDRHSLETFYKARERAGLPQPSESPSPSP